MPLTKTLYILRHGKAETGSATLDDHERGLNQQGIDACAVIGKYMVDKAIKPDLVLCSTAKRAKTTWNLVKEASKCTSKQEFTDALYLASANEIVKQLACLPETMSSVMVVGHNPGLHQLCLNVSKQGDEDLLELLMMKFPTCAFASIDLGAVAWEDITQANATLMEFTTPKILVQG